MTEKEYAAFLDDIRLTFGSERGKRVMADLRKSFTYRAMDQQELEPLRLAYREGQRSVVLKIEALLEAAQDQAQVASGTKKPAQEVAE